MPHVKLDGEVELERVVGRLSREPQRWHRTVLKNEASWLRADGLAVLVEGVVIEHSRPLHPVAVISLNSGNTSVRLWRLAPVERTPAVQRWLASIAAELCRLGGLSLKTTNITEELWNDLGMDARSS
jgi:hypothetical protein